MATPELMTWDSKSRRWTKQYMGRRYWISCRQLRAASTKEGSIHAANQWWRNKQAELDLVYRVAHRAPQPMEDIAAAALGQSPDAFADIRRLLESALLREEAVRPKGNPSHSGDDEIVVDAPDPDESEQTRRCEVMGLLERLLFGDPMIPAAVKESLSPARVHEIEEGARLIRGQAEAKPNQSVGSLIAEYLDKQQARVTVGQMGIGRWDTIRRYLAHVGAFLGDTAPVATITSEKLEGLHFFCLSKIADKRDGKNGWSPAYAKGVFAVGREWMRWLWERGIIPPLANLSSRGFRFGCGPGIIKTWTVDEVRHVISEAPGKLKLALVLMVNCGMTQKDVSDLLDTEVDWQAGRIVRKRSKTRRHANTPCVSYPLWPLTLELLQQHRSGTERVLITPSGRHYVREDRVNGRLVSCDLIAASFGDLRRRLGFTKPMKQLRKTAATLLESHEQYGRFTSLFLGHAPQTMKDRHYAAPPQVLFDEAVIWLGRHLGYIST